jgi:hypothetical protein
MKSSTERKLWVAGEEEEEEKSKMKSRDNIIRSQLCFKGFVSTGECGWVAE